MKYNIEKVNDKCELIHIDNELNLKATLASFGAGVYALSFKDKPVILTLDSVEDYCYSPQFYGKTLGVVAGRLKKDGLIDGNEYHLNPDLNKNFSLHGGNENSISFRDWKYKIKETNKKLDVTFSIATKNNENGFPGKLRVYVTYSFLKNKDEFKILFKATTPSEATFINLSNHMYFNFGTQNISDYYLKMNCNRVAVTEPDLLIVSDQDITEHLDFNKANKLNRRMDWIEKNDFKGTIDDTFLFSELPGKVILNNKDIKLQITTDCSAMNIYVDNSMTNVKFRDRDDYNMRRGIALEPQRYLLNKDEIILRKGEVYKNYIDYKFREK